MYLRTSYEPSKLQKVYRYSLKGGRSVVNIHVFAREAINSRSNQLL